MNRCFGIDSIIYEQFVNNYVIKNLLAEDWFVLHKRFNQNLSTYFFKQKIDSC